VSDSRKRLLYAGGYVLFFVVSFVFFFVLTFDARIVFGIVQEQASRQKIELTASDVELEGIIGLDMKGLTVKMLSSRGEQQTYNFERVIVSPSLSTLVGAASAAPKGAPFPMDVSFLVGMGEGTIKGDLEGDGKKIRVSDLEADRVPLSRLPFNSSALEDFALGGFLTARIEELTMDDLKQTNTWNGEIQADLLQPSVSDFKYAGISIAGIAMESGSLRAKIKEGELDLGTLRLDGNDVPIDLSGKINLRMPITNSELDLKGTISPSDEYKEKVPLIQGMLTKEEVSIKGTLGAPMMTSE